MEGPGERAQLVARAHFRERGIEVPLRQRDGTGGQAAQWRGETPREPHDHGGQDGQARQSERGLQQDQPARSRQELGFRVHRGQRPPTRAHRHVGHPVRSPGQAHRLEALAAGEHPLDDRRHVRARLGVQPAGAGAGDRQLRVSEQAALPGQQDRVSRAAHVNLAHEAPDSVQGDVGGDHRAHRPPRRRPEDRHRVGHHHHVAATLVEVGLRPAGLPGEGRLEVPLLLPVAIALGGQLGQAQLGGSHAAPVDVRREPVTGRIEGPQGKGRRRAVDVRVPGHESAQPAVQLLLRRSRKGQRGGQHAAPFLDRPEYALRPVHGRLRRQHGLTLGRAHRALTRKTADQDQRQAAHSPAEQEDPGDQARGEAPEAAAHRICFSRPALSSG